MAETAAEAALRRSRERVEAARAFEEQTGMTQAQYQKANREAKPNLKEFMDASGLSFNEAGSIMGTATFNQRDPRNWAAIMASDDPGLAARLATRQAIEAGAYDKNAPHFRQPGFDSSNYRDVQIVPEGLMGLAQVNRPTGRGRENIQYHLMTPEGRRLTQLTGYDPNLAYEDQSESVQAGLARFGLDPATQAAYEDSMSYLVEGMDPSIYYGIDWDPTYDPDPRNQPQAQAQAQTQAPISQPQAVVEETASTEAPSFSYTGTALPSSSYTASSAARPTARGPRPYSSSGVPIEGILSALLKELS